MEAEKQQFQEWKGQFTRKYPGIETDGEKFLDWLVICQGSESEDAYLFGVREGILIAEVIFGDGTETIRQHKTRRGRHGYNRKKNGRN